MIPYLNYTPQPDYRFWLHNTSSVLILHLVICKMSASSTSKCQNSQVQQSEMIKFLIMYVVTPLQR